ncbi:hypothetical protein BHM03_00056944 [Ensete ventricosum]|nr:hypothetical protein BHM03_00056944 [Ensete ventricosum]
MDETNQQATAAKSDVYYREFDVVHNGNGPRLPAIHLACTRDHERAPLTAPSLLLTTVDFLVPMTTTAFTESVPCKGWNLQKILNESAALHCIHVALPCPLFINERHLPRSLLSILLEKKEKEKQKEKKMAEIELQQPDRGEKNDAAPQSIFAKAQRPINLEVHERPTLGPCQFYSCS